MRSDALKAAFKALCLLSLKEIIIQRAAAIEIDSHLAPPDTQHQHTRRLNTPSECTRSSLEEKILAADTTVTTANLPSDVLEELFEELRIGEDSMSDGGASLESPAAVDVTAFLAPHIAPNIAAIEVNCTKKESEPTLTWSVTVDRKLNTVRTWGNARFGGYSKNPVTGETLPGLQSGISRIYSNPNAFAALTGDGGIEAWGDAHYGGDVNDLKDSSDNSPVSGVTSIFKTSQAFAGLKSDGSVLAWGDARSGGDLTSVKAELDKDVVNVYSNDHAFAALKKSGSGTTTTVIPWGHPHYGGVAESYTVTPPAQIVLKQLGGGVPSDPREDKFRLKDILPDLRVNQFGGRVDGPTANITYARMASPHLFHLTVPDPSTFPCTLKGAEVDVKKLTITSSGQLVSLTSIQEDATEKTHTPIQDADTIYAQLLPLREECKFTIKDGISLFADTQLNLIIRRNGEDVPLKKEDFLDDVKRAEIFDFSVPDGVSCAFDATKEEDSVVGYEPAAEEDENENGGENGNEGANGNANEENTNEDANENADENVDENADQPADQSGRQMLDTEANGDSEMKKRRAEDANANESNAAPIDNTLQLKVTGEEVNCLTIDLYGMKFELNPGYFLDLTCTKHDLEESKLAALTEAWTPQGKSSD